MNDSRPVRPVDRSGFHVAILCALRCEADAVEALFDNFWEETGPRYGKAPRDPNSYALGSIGPHNVVLVYMPGMGNINSTRVTMSLTVSFPNLRIGLVVGICGGVPQSQAHKSQIFLGDVIVSTGVVQYDFGWKYPDKFVHKDTLHSNLGLPQHEVRAFLNMLQGIRSRKILKQRMSELVTHIARQEGFENAGRPDPAQDRLYESAYRHKHHEDDSCSVCNACTAAQDPICQVAFTSSCEELGCRQVVDRGIVRNVSELHFGQIASAEVVMKSAQDRDDIALKESVIGFEMEGAGAWDSLPTIVIKGVCDYADSHKNDDWHLFASVVAAACAGAILERWREESDLRPTPANTETSEVSLISWSRHGVVNEASIAQSSDSLNAIPHNTYWTNMTASSTPHLNRRHPRVQVHTGEEWFPCPPNSSRPHENPAEHKPLDTGMAGHEVHFTLLNTPGYGPALNPPDTPRDDNFVSDSSDRDTSQGTQFTDQQDGVEDGNAHALEESLANTVELVHGHSSRAVTDPYSWGLTGKAISKTVLGMSQIDVYSQVCEVEDFNTGELFVRKILHPKTERGHTVAKLTEAIKERVERMYTARHTHVASIVHWFANPVNVFVYMHPVAEYSLHDYLNSKPTRDNSLTLIDTWFGCLASALSHAHSLGIVHGNIKTSNILIKSRDPYLTDFGSLVDSRYDRGVSCITDLYPIFPTELHRRSQFDDVLVLGCIFAQILHLRCRDESQQHDSVDFERDILTVREWLTCLEGLRVNTADKHLLVVCSETRKMLSSTSVARRSAQEVKRNMHRNRGSQKLFCPNCY